MKKRRKTKQKSTLRVVDQRLKNMEQHLKNVQQCKILQDRINARESKIIDYLLERDKHWNECHVKNLKVHRSVREYIDLLEEKLRVQMPICLIFFITFLAVLFWQSILVIK